MNSIITKIFALSVIILGASILWACSDQSPTKINIEAVEKALNETKAENPEGWTSAFEERVNEIYEGEGIVSVSSKTDNGMLKVIGFIDKNGFEDYQDDDEKVFEIEQTAAATEQGTPAVVRSYTNYGSPVEHHTSLVGMLFQGWLIHSAVNAIFNNYHTPTARMSSLNTRRQEFRSSPHFAEQKAANASYQKTRQPVARVSTNNTPSAGVKTGAKETGISLTKRNTSTGTRFGGGRSIGRRR